MRQMILTALIDPVSELCSNTEFKRVVLLFLFVHLAPDPSEHGNLKSQCLLNPVFCNGFHNERSYFNHLLEKL